MNLREMYMLICGNVIYSQLFVTENERSIIHYSIRDQTFLILKKKKVIGGVSFEL